MAVVLDSIGLLKELSGTMSSLEAAPVSIAAYPQKQKLNVSKPIEAKKATISVENIPSAQASITKLEQEISSLVEKRNLSTNEDVVAELNTLIEQQRDQLAAKESLFISEGLFFESNTRARALWDQKAIGYQVRQGRAQVAYEMQSPSAYKADRAIMDMSDHSIFVEYNQLIADINEILDEMDSIDLIAQKGLIDGNFSDTNKTSLTYDLIRKHDRLKERLEPLEKRLETLTLTHGNYLKSLLSQRIAELDKAHASIDLMAYEAEALDAAIEQCQTLPEQKQVYMNMLAHIDATIKADEKAKIEQANRQQQFAFERAKENARAFNLAEIAVLPAKSNQKPSKRERTKLTLRHFASKTEQKLKTVKSKAKAEIKSAIKKRVFNL